MNTPENDHAVTLVGSDTVPELRRRIEELEAEVKKVNDFRESLSAKFRDKSDSLSEAMARIEELEASAVVMRQRLEEVLEVCDLIDDEDQHQTTLINSALSTIAGADFLARYKAMEVELAEAKRLIDACLHTGGLRTDSTRQLYLDVCKFLEVEP